MSDKGLLFRHMIRTLREARHAVRAELNLHAPGQPSDVLHLARLRAAAAELVQQANMLIVMMEMESADPAMIDEAEELCGFFRAAADHVAVSSADVRSGP